MLKLQEYADLLRLVSAVASTALLLGGGYAFMWIRKYFPERKEATSPEQLNTALEKQNITLCEKIEKTDFSTREALNASLGRVQTAFESQQRRLSEDLSELKGSMIEAHRKAARAHEEAQNANHKAELVENNVNGLERLLNEKIDHLMTLVKGGNK